MGLVMIGVAGGVRREEVVIVVGEDIMAEVIGGVRRDGLGAVGSSGWLLVDTRL